MSYEVYVDVRHHPRHLDDFERKLVFAAKMAEPDGSDPTDVERLRAVAAVLRGSADKLDPDWHCTHCGQTRGEHFHLHSGGLSQCFGRYGPVTQWAWWQEANVDAPTPDAQ